MKKIILDTNILIRQPKILATKTPGITLILTNTILDELNRNNIPDRETVSTRADIINQAINDGIAELYDDSLRHINSNHEFWQSNLSTADKSLLLAAQHFKGLGDEVYIATSDKEIWEVSRRLDINIYTNAQIRELIDLAKEPSQNTTLKKKIDRFESRQYFRILINSGTAFIVGIITIILKAYGEIIFNTLHVWGTILLFLLIGIGIFLWREWRRLSYGIFEFLFGFATIIYALLPGFDIHELTKLDTDIKLVGGLYIMVRGQDNLVKALKGTKPGLFLSQKLNLGN